jgi:Glu-tRNA(Gln) amidotransferase subunit E-like FAD-binding protein
MGLIMLSESEVKQKVKELIASNKGLPSGRLMGITMAELRGKADAQIVKKIIEELS